MSFVSDSIFETFLTFRLGNYRQEELCLYSESKQVSPQLIPRSSLPLKSEHSHRIIVVSDTHERHACIGEIPRGDIFIHAGDILMTNSRASHRTGKKKLSEFNEWLGEINCPTKLVIAGNHDRVIEVLGQEGTQSILSNAIYMENSLVEIDNLKIWGTPVSSGRSSNSAFQHRGFVTQSQEIAEQYKRGDIDILLTHGPCLEFAAKMRPAVHIWGHAHYYHGIRRPGEKLWENTLEWVSVNASIMDGKYNPSQYPVVLDYTKK